MGRAYYNEIDRDAAHVLRALIADDVIAPGDVDERSIKDVRPDDLVGYTQCHFFAGGGLWSVAARLAGWPDDRPLWTGSCPCQPFSQAGKQAGTDDPRHLWPDFFRLIRDASAAGYGPPVVMGEQVGGALGQHWFDGVGADLASIGFTSRSRDIPACAVDAPHQRNRIFWIAEDALDDRQRTRLERQRGNGDRGDRRPGAVGSIAETDDVLLADANRGGCSGWQETSQRDAEERAVSERAGDVVFSDATLQRRREGWPEYELRGGRNTAADADIRDGVFRDAASDGRQQGSTAAAPARHGNQPSSAYGRNGSWWSDADWIVSPIDGKARRAKPGICFLVDGLPGRVGLWRIGGNAISPVLAAEVIGAYLDLERTAA